MMKRRLLVLGFALVIANATAHAADLYWDMDPTAPLVGNGTSEGISGSFFSTAPSGDTALTTIGGTNDVYFQVDTVQDYTVHLDASPTVGTMTVDNGNSVTLTTSDSSAITCTNKIVVQGGSSLTFHHLSNSRVLIDSPRPSIELGAGDNTFTIRGVNSSTAYRIAAISGDAGDRMGVTNNNHWTLLYDTSVFGGELFGPWRISPRAGLTLTGDSDDFSGKLEGGSVTLGEGGTSGSIGTATVNPGTLKFNRSDDVLFTNRIILGNQAYFHNLGTGKTTITSDMSGSQLRFYGDGGTVSGDIYLSQFLWNEGPGTWVLTGSNTVQGGVVSGAIMARNGGTFQIGDGTGSASLALLDATRYFQLQSTSDLAMDIRTPALLDVAGDLHAGDGSSNYLIITGDGQETPIITFGGSMTSSFDGVIYNGVTYTWAEAQTPKALGGVTQLRVESNAIYIDPLPPQGTLIWVY